MFLGFDFLAIAAVCWVVGHAIGDISYAVQGKTPPRIAYRAERAAAREARTGKPARTRTEGASAFRNYLANLWHDAWTDAHTRRADRRTDRAAAYAAARNNGTPAKDAARESGFGMLPRLQTAAAGILPRQADPEPAQAERSAWEIQFEHEPADAEMRIACGACGETLTQNPYGIWEHPAKADCAEATSPSTPTSATTSTEGTTAMNGEAINYETTLAAHEEMLSQLTKISDYLTLIDVAVIELQSTAEQITAAGATFNLTAGALDGAQDVVDHLGPDDLHDLMTRADNAYAGVNASRDHLIATYGDAADIMATTGTDGAFVNA